VKEKSCIRGMNGRGYSPIIKYSSGQRAAREKQKMQTTKDVLVIAFKKQKNTACVPWNKGCGEMLCAFVVKIFFVKTGGWAFAGRCEAM
jgi:hypothetical protein